MIQRDVFKLICYNCGATIGLVKTSEPVPSNNEKRGVDQIIHYSSHSFY